MIAVADTGPLDYLVLIGAVNVLQPLYGRVIVPQTVADELQEPGAPARVRSWIRNPPQWCEVRPDVPGDPRLQFLGPGERAAIALAVSLRADRLLIDEWEGVPKGSVVI
jgi:predicted nucleic acid-binding protein